MMRFYSRALKVAVVVLTAFLSSSSIGYSQSNDVDTLSGKLKDEDPNVREKAAGALAETKDPKAVKLLIDAYNKDTSEDVKAKILRALAEIKNDNAIEFLLSKLNDKDKGVRWQIAGVVQTIQDVRVTKALAARLKAEDLYVVVGAYRHFISKGEKGTERVLIRAFTETGATTVMIEDLLNCGNPELSRAAVALAKKYGSTIKGSRVFSELRSQDGFTLVVEAGDSGLRWGMGR